MCKHNRGALAAVVVTVLLVVSEQAVAQAPVSSVTIGSAIEAQRFARSDHGPVLSSMPLHMMIVLRRNAEQQADLERFVASQHDPNSVNFHHWLTPAEFGVRFGASQATLDKAAKWLQSSGMTGVHLSNGRQFIAFSGAAGAASKAFRTEIHKFTVRGVTHYANTKDLSVPSDIGNLISTVIGLQDLTPGPALSTASQPAFINGSGNTNTLGPADLATIYDIDELYRDGVYGDGVTVAVLGRTPIGLADYEAYRQQFGLPPNDFQVVAFPGSESGTGDPSDAEEASLDLEVLGGIARNSKILYAWGPTIDSAAWLVIDEQLAQVMSESYVACECEGHQYYEAMALQANAEGITWVSSAGDSGAAGCDVIGSSTATQGLSVVVPASAPNITAVGGTTLTEASSSKFWNSTNDSQDDTALSYIPETGWSSGSSVLAGGGGVSRVFGKPGYQSDFDTATTSGRLLPDVSFAADPSSAPYFIVLNGGGATVSGTSAATPLFAGIVALVNGYLVKSGDISQPGLANINQVLYQLDEINPAVFHDVTTGSNDVPCAALSLDCANGVLGYPAHVGYDEATGLGSVDAYALATAWTSTSLVSSEATLRSSALQLEAEQDVTFSASVQTNSGPLVGSPVQFYLANATNQANAVLLATVNSDATGTATYAADFLPIGPNTITALATGTTSAAPAPPAVSVVSVSGVPSSISVQPVGGPFQAGQTATVAVEVEVPSGALLFGPSNSPYYGAGSVSLYTTDGKLQSTVIPDENGIATLTVGPLAQGQNQFFVSYSGNFYVAPSQSASMTISAAASSLTPDFLLNGPSAVTLAAGSSGSISFLITPLNGFNQPIQLSCSGPTGAVCSVPNTVTALAPIDVALTVVKSNSVLASSLPGALLLMLLGLMKGTKRRFAAVLSCGIVLVLLGCGTGPREASAPPVTYPVTVTAVSGTVSHQLVVNVSFGQ